MKKNLLYLLLLSLLVNQAAWAQKFVNRISGPPAIISGMQGTFMMDIDTGMHNFNPNNGIDTLIYQKGGKAYKFIIDSDTLIKTMCYNQRGSTAISYLGPTMIWDRSQKITLDVKNNLTQSTTMHFHGINLPSDMDGGPHEVIDPKSMWGGSGMALPVPSFNVIDAVQTGWYHSHLMDSTTEQVALGLSGMIIVEDNDTKDPVRKILPHTYNKNDFPIVIQEKAFNFINTSIDTIAINGDTTIVTRQKVASIIQTNQPGPANLVMVNGVLNGALHVPNSVTRLRLLNGSTNSTLKIAVSKSVKVDTNSTVNLDSMWLIATDGGYTPKASYMKQVRIAPGERYEMLLDCSKYKSGDTLYMQTTEAPTRGPGSTFPVNPNHPIINGVNPTSFMALVIDPSITPDHPINTIPDTLVATYPTKPDTSNVFNVKYGISRTKILNGGGGGNPWTIDGNIMDMDLVNDTLLVGTSEIWTIINTTGRAHPFHIHKIQFQVLDITNASGKQSVYNNTLPRHLVGFKDNVLVMPGDTLRFIAKFEYYGNQLLNNQIDIMDGFMYHCHILPHEDNAMMQQFVVLDTPAYNKITGRKIGIREYAHQEQANLSFYPNPAGNVLYIKGYTSSKGNIRFTDILGRMIKEENVAVINGNASIQVDDLPRGFVFVEYTSGNTRTIEKILLH